MRRVLAIALAFVAACQAAPTAPPYGSDPRCYYKGDTIGVLSFRDTTGRIVKCVYLGSDKTFCYATPVDKTPPPCVVGSFNVSTLLGERGAP